MAPPPPPPPRAAATAGRRRHRRGPHRRGRRRARRREARSPRRSVRRAASASRRTEHGSLLENNRYDWMSLCSVVAIGPITEPAGGSRTRTYSSKPGRATPPTLRSTVCQPIRSWSRGVKILVAVTGCPSARTPVDLTIHRPSSSSRETSPSANPPSVSNIQVRNCLSRGSHPIRWVPLRATWPSILTSNWRMRNEPLSDHEHVVETSSSSLSFSHSPSIHSRSFR